MLENDIGLGNRSNPNSLTPTMGAPLDGATSHTTSTSTWRARQFAGSQLASSSDYMQQSRKNFVSYKAFLSSYWGYFPQSATRKLGENSGIMHSELSL